MRRAAAATADGHLVLAVGNDAQFARFARLALDCVGREYPNKIAHVMQGDADALPPRRLTPAFFGCYDWHSAVHGHWLLARLARAEAGLALNASKRNMIASRIAKRLRATGDCSNSCRRLATISTS